MRVGLSTADTVFKKFGASKEKKVEQQQKLIEALASVWPENPLLPEIKRVVEKLTAH